MPHRIALVGHCNVDGPRLQKEVSQCIQGAQVTRVNDEEALRKCCEEGADLLLVNREPVGFAGSEGVDLIRQVKQDYPDQKALLVSDYPEAQQEAQAAGAQAGFGKADMGSPKLADTIRQALKQPSN